MNPATVVAWCFVFGLAASRADAMLVKPTSAIATSEIRENVLIITTSLADPQADARRTAFPAAGSPEATARTTRHRPAKSLSLLRFVGQKPQDDIVRFRLRPTETGGAEDRSPG
ncbi:hypothetical protein [Methylobacterium persicinum]|uniref:Uncharacterized protein n=1 Tax=Methylobacterium persicinum TaxID=374426 RepID=A0ABU0HH81_9HYPH|nr:hypothetical protein [Methylobacterium persicinum]MDQ0441677.1 hypothetical protein [Methylobacterium persicinum]